MQRIEDLLQCGPFITLSLGSIGMNLVISETCYKKIILQRNYRKMTISFNSFVKLHVKKIQIHIVMSYTCKRIALYKDFAGTHRT